MSDLVLYDSIVFLTIENIGIDTKNIRIAGILSKIFSADEISAILAAIL